MKKNGTIYYGLVDFKTGCFCHTFSFISIWIYLCFLVTESSLCSTIHSGYFPPEVITYDQWVLLKPEPKGLFSGWIKGAFRGGKKEMQESIHQKLNFTLRTAPMWDRFAAPCLRFLYSCSLVMSAFFLHCCVFGQKVISSSLD